MYWREQGGCEMWQGARGSDHVSQRPPVPREAVWTWPPLRNPLLVVTDVKNLYEFLWLINEISNKGQECRTPRSSRYRYQPGPLSPCCWVQGNSRETWSLRRDCFLGLRSAPQEMAEVQGVRAGAAGQQGDDVLGSEGGHALVRQMAHCSCHTGLPSLAPGVSLEPFAWVSVEHAVEGLTTVSSVIPEVFLSLGAAGKKKSYNLIYFPC